MIKLDIKNLFQIEKDHGISKKEFNSKTDLISKYLKQIGDKDQGFYSILDDKKTIKDIRNFSKKIKDKFDYIIVLGIGGSALGPICLNQTLNHLFITKLYVLDNIDPILIKEIEDVIDYKRTLFIVITKSGETSETLSEYFYFREKINNKKLDPKKHFVFVTDPVKGLLREIGNKEKITMFDIPENVGGRFSVLTAVGLLPAHLTGIKIEKLIDGAKKMRQSFLNKKLEQNLPFQLALTQYLLGQKGKNQNVLIPYSQKLIKFADWFRQLLAESIGKTEDIGLTPINALGATDQHSQLQLYNDGPNNKLIIFIEVENFGTDLKIPNLYKNVTFGKLLNTEKKGTEQALTHNNRPNITIKIDKIDEETLGGLFMLFEGATAFLGELYNINAFNQPGVELSKKLTKKMLSKNHS